MPKKLQFLAAQERQYYCTEMTRMHARGECDIMGFKHEPENREGNTKKQPLAKATAERLWKQPSHKKS